MRPDNSHSISSLPSILEGRDLCRRLAICVPNKAEIGGGGCPKCARGCHSNPGEGEGGGGGGGQSKHGRWEREHYNLGLSSYKEARYTALEPSLCPCLCVCVGYRISKWLKPKP